MGPKNATGATARSGQKEAKQRSKKARQKRQNADANPLWSWTAARQGAAAQRGRTGLLGTLGGQGTACPDSPTGYRSKPGLGPLKGRFRRREAGAAE